MAEITGFSRRCRFPWELNPAHLVAGLLSVGLAFSSYAETPSIVTATADPVSSDGLAEIIVTATKRNQALQDVPITVSVLDARQLADRRIETLSDIAEAVPGLSYSTSANNTPVYTLRGVGFNDQSLSAYPTVSVYLDEAPLAFPVLSEQGAFDLQRIEVLKGPQGTLFGQNSTGGAINYIAAKPTDTFTAGVEGTYSRFNTVETNGFAGGPLADDLTFRLAMHYVHGDDYQYSYTRDDSLGKTDVLAARGILTWKPTEQATFSLNLNGWHDGSDPQAGQLVAVHLQTPFGSAPALLRYPFAPQNDRAADWTPDGVVTPAGNIVDFRPRSDRTFFQGVLRSDYELPSAVTITSVTSAIAFTQRQASDYDGIALNDADTPLNDGSIHTYYEELRASNSSQAEFRWTAGGNYQHSWVIEDDAIRYGDSTDDFPGLNDIIGNGYSSRIFRRDYAFFANGEFDVTSRLTLQAGARYTDNLTQANIVNYDLGDGRIDSFLSELGYLLTGKLVPLTPGQDASLNFNNVPAVTPFDESLQEKNVSWRGGAQYRLTPDIMYYANVSRGYKAGSFPTISASTFKQLIPVTQESVTAYETGVKSALFNRRLTFDAAAFYYRYDDKQILGKEQDPVFGLLNVLVNVPKSELYGAEFEAAWRPVEGFNMTAAVTFVTSRIDQYVGTNVIGQPANFAGDAIPFSPKWQGSLDGEYLWNIGRSWRPFIGADITARTSTMSYILPQDFVLPASPLNSIAPGVSNPFEINGYTLVDLRTGVASADGKFRGTLWGKNVFDKYYVNDAISGFDTIYRLAGRPATFGLTVSYKY
jgi:iron complex outermembrane receptor protein